MEINDFITNFAELFDDTDVSEISASTKYRELDEWSSLMGMAIISMVKTEYGKSITGSMIRSCDTVEDLYNLVKNK